MYTQISQMEPLFPARTGELEDLARELVATSAQLQGRLAPAVVAELRTLLRVVNSYYSNLIEGHSTHPVEIERAMRNDYSAEQDKRDLQIESRIHIEVQNKIAEELQTDPQTNVVAAEFLCRLHGEFYDLMPERLRWATGAGEERAWVKAGAIREQYVRVGNHVPPAPEALNGFLQRFEQAFNPSGMHGLRPLIALTAAHHRLTWIHPFLDGNGRVARLFTDAYFQRIKLAGYGLWNVSRGLARRRTDYREFLAAADSPRQGDLDGRGNLSDRMLTDFCRFFLEVCLDQTTYMNGLLALNGLLDRLERYVVLRNSGLVVDVQGKTAAALHPRVAALLKVVATTGEISRGEAFRVIEMSERTGRNILKTLLDEGMLLTRSDKGPVRLGFPAHVAGYWFPQLYPTEDHR
ncbi:MAG TPA: Fic family protein [Blastocatellia bacterium]|nr:Fic family protein [Blastocatellia bacterium]HMX25924.1 Fic family protein [Blastocatellia bacterium]HMY71484.1 Fic family protein [Blastocatellia bacterium]HMZ20271.1 Fic family protein [Blastocatellia bacterium]HNG28730.1 Fic family protein [Blastocatellia bacterium]